MAVTNMLVILLSVLIYSVQSTNITINTRIVGGVLANIQQLPYTVSIQYFSQHFCGGALITRGTVLSAAHCFGSSMSSVSTFYEVRVGSNTTLGDPIKIESVLVHPQYSSDTINYDISLIKLATNVTISDRIIPIRISANDNYVAGSYATVSGWGYQSENGSISSLLRRVDVPIVSPTQCAIDYVLDINITENMICAGYRQGGRDACQGDSGGPLVQNSQLIGVVSFGMGCARKYYPGVYTNVARLLPWVAANSNYNLTYNATNNTDYFMSSGCGSCDIGVIIVVVGLLMGKLVQ